jgi:hypothetical protein
MTMGFSAERAAARAAWLVFAAFAMHALNALYLEPTYLGFRNPATDYAKIALLKGAIGSVPWTLSGLGHLVSGFALVYLARVAPRLFPAGAELPGQVAVGAGLLGAAGFLLTGISDLVGGGPFGLPVGAVGLLAAQNPDLEGAIYVAQSLTRIAFNSLAQVGLGWYAVMVSWGGLRSGALPAWFGRFGYFSGLCGVLMGVLFAPLYLYTVLAWSLGFAVILGRRARAGA